MNGVPLFDGKNYALQSSRMQHYLHNIGYDVKRSVINGYQVPTNLPIDTTRKNLYNDNARAMNAILDGLQNSEHVKIMHCTTTK